MDYKKNEIKAGIMIMVSVTILGAFLVAIFGIGLGEDTKEYRVYLQYVGGISEGSLVKYRGMDVGQVKAITLPDSAETRIGVTLAVDMETPVRVDSKALLTSISLMSDQHIEISAGSPESSLLPAGSIISSKEVLTFAQMSEALGALNNQAQILLTRVSDILSEENRSHFSSVLDNVDDLLQKSREPFLTTVTNLENFSGHLSDMSTDINKLIDKNGNSIQEMLANIKATAEVTNHLISELRGISASLESLVVSNNSSVLETMENFQAASQNLVQFSQILKERPWLLVRKASPPDRKY